MKRLLILTAIAALAALASGCASPMGELTPMTPMAPPPAASLEGHENPGSVYDPGQADFLFSDRRARRVGDLVMIKVVESSAGKHKADTTAEKESSLSLGVEQFFGSSLGYNVGEDAMLSASTTSSSDATGETERAADLTATVAARIINVLPNEVLQVHGQRQIRINNENQVLVVSGLIRAEDIEPDNSISSDALAEAQIQYYGQGVLADKQKQGWGTRIIDNIWPF
jgi:flagellar L-ring protein precursor FlgH